MTAFDRLVALATERKLWMSATVYFGESYVNRGLVGPHARIEIHTATREEDRELRGITTQASNLEDAAENMLKKLEGN